MSGMPCGRSEKGDAEEEREVQSVTRVAAGRKRHLRNRCRVRSAGGVLASLHTEVNDSPLRPKDAGMHPPFVPSALHTDTMCRKITRFSFISRGIAKN